MCRFRWRKHSVAFWDNRSTAHKGVNDFYPAHRLMHRVAVADTERPR
ncbi:MAG: TauD/TfdA family dioxygenase [Gammaproteobacteria bacterium]